MPGKVFISYRRDDAAGHAGRLYDRLKAAFPERVFLDIGEIPPGADFLQVIEQHVAECSALIALIGNNWTAHDRLHEPHDFVRLEISSALKRTITVIPVLVGGAKLPTATALPEDLQALLRRQTISISDEDWGHGCERLVQALEKVMGPARRGSGSARRWGFAAAAALVVAVAALGYWKVHNPQAPTKTAGAAPSTMPETTRAASDYDKSVAKGYDNAAQVMSNIADQIGGAGNTPVPSISSISPKSARSGTIATITGTNFGATQGTVKFGSTPVVITSWSSTAITVQVPVVEFVSGHDVEVPVVVSAGASNSSPAKFTVLLRSP